MKVDKSYWGIWFGGKDRNYFMPNCFALSRQESIRAICYYWRLNNSEMFPWKRAYREGLRCIKVTIKERK